MSPLHRSWLADQADAITRQQHERVLRDSALAFAHPSPDVTRAARALRTKLDGLGAALAGKALLQCR